MEKNVDHYLEKPKKKKKLDKYESLAPNKPKAAKNFKIIDDDIDMNSLIPNQEAEILVDLLDPEGPLIADDSMIAEAEMRSKATEKVEAFANNKWIKVDVFENEDGDMVVAEEQQQSTSLFKKRGEKHKSQTTAKEDDNDDLDVPRKAKEKAKDAVKTDSDGDISPVRIKPRREAEPKRSSNNGNKDEDMDDIPRRRPNVKREPNSDDDMDDVPRRRPSSQSSANIKREPDADGDLSPVRRSSKHDRSEREKPSRKRSEDRDLSPVRRSSTSSSGKQHPKVKTEKDSSPDRDRDRKSSSNQHHSRHRDDNSRDTSKNGDVEEREKISLRRNKPTKDDEAKKAKEEELKKKYDVWKKGLVQVKQHEEKINDYVHEMNKPVARHADDKDLEKLLKDQEREDDPMLEYMRKAKEEEEAKNEPNKPPKRVYRGPPAPPNRYNILPGSKWDGVDRSNGFEKKYYESLTARKVRQEEAYKWSVEDM